MDRKTDTRSDFARGFDEGLKLGLILGMVGVIAITMAVMTILTSPMTSNVVVECRIHKPDQPMVVKYLSHKSFGTSTNPESECLERFGGSYLIEEAVLIMPE